jgi:hypothetical protein
MSKIIKNNPIISAIVIGFIFVVIAYYVSNLGYFEEFDLWSLIDAYATSLTLVLVVYNLKQNQMQMQQIPIYFNDKKLNLDITRKDFSRSELQGILGILRNDVEKPYNVAYLSKIEYLDAIYKIQKSELDELKIEITEDELKKFRNDIYETINNN